MQHIRSHHKYVATAEDSSTGRYNETVYSYLVRAFPDGQRYAWQCEKARLNKQGRSEWSLENKSISFNIAQVVYFACVAQVLGLYAMCFHLLYSFLCVANLEVVNYIEHYGLLRAKDKNGVYESVTVKHSWNAPQVLGNCMAFKV